MATRSSTFQPEAVSISALVQQISVNLFDERKGYWWFVSGVIEPDVEPEWVDAIILRKYDIQKDWRDRKAKKDRGEARLWYIRHGRIYYVLSTRGHTFFKQSEREAIRCVRRTGREGFAYSPLLVPVDFERKYDLPPKKKKKRRPEKPSDPVFNGYALSYRQGRYKRKTQEEREAYQQAVELWRRQTASGKKLPRPDRQLTPDEKWHAHVEIEASCYERLEKYFIRLAPHWSSSQLITEFKRLPFEPYWPIKRQLNSLLNKCNTARKHQSLAPVPRKEVFKDMLRDQVTVFEKEAA